MNANQTQIQNPKPKIIQPYESYWQKPNCIPERHIATMPTGINTIEGVERYILDLEAEIAHIGYQLDSYSDGWLPNSCRNEAEGANWRDGAINARALRWQQLIICQFTIGHKLLDEKYGKS